MGHYAVYAAHKRRPFMVVSVVGKLIVIHRAQKTCYSGDSSFLHFSVQTGTYFLVADVADKVPEVYTG